MPVRIALSAHSAEGFPSKYSKDENVIKKPNNKELVWRNVHPIGSMYFSASTTTQFAFVLCQLAIRISRFAPIIPLSLLVSAMDFAAYFFFLTQTLLSAKIF